MESIASSLLKLEERSQGFRIENLLKNELFQSTLLNATVVAVRNHQKEKREALRNAVLNTALQTAADEDLQLMFLAFIDVFTPTHLRILRFFDDPQRWAQEHNLTYPNSSFGPPSAALQLAFPELAREFYDAVVKDLADRGLIHGNVQVGMTASAMISSRTTTMGKRFLIFISSPIQDADLTK